MAIRYVRLYYQIIKYSLTCLVMSIILLFSVSFTIQNRSLFHLNLFHLQHGETAGRLNHSSSTYHVEQTKFYPHLPIQIYTENRHRFGQLKNTTKKLILLGSTMFGDPTWSMASVRNGTNGGNMSELFCSFLNDHCEITHDQRRFRQADAVVYHVRDPVNRSHEIMKNRRDSQRFVFALWEPPVNTPDLSSYKNFFNWTMTYRFDSHVFASYFPSAVYRLRSNLWLKETIADYQTNEEKIVAHENISTGAKWGTVAALISNCAEASQKRWLLITELQKYVDVTVYGKCGHPCPTSADNGTLDCRAYIAEHYYFILAFENSFCQDYATEKFFSSLVLPIVPVVYGQVDYTRFIPQSGFIDIRHFPTISDLADRLNQLKNNRTLYQEFFQWKRRFVWGGFSTYMTPFCDLCLRLHLDTTPSIVHDVQQWWFDRTCH